MPTAPQISAKAVLDDPSEASSMLFAFSGLEATKSAFGRLCPATT